MRLDSRNAVSAENRSFDFATATRILFGPGKLAELGDAARRNGSSAFVVTGRDPGRAEPVHAPLDAAGVRHETFCVGGEPSVQGIAKAVDAARAAGSDLVIAIGGGSALDAGKAVAAMLTNSGSLMDHLEVIGGGRPLREASAPFIAVPTTAGTGAEVTRNAVIASAEHRVKVSLRSPRMLPTLALVDPVLTLELPPPITASTGLDALTQLIEPYVSCRANPMTDLFCREGIQLVAGSIRRVYADGRDLGARSDMALASLYGGLALANAGLGAVHGFAGPLGGMYPAPHGAVCAALLAPCSEVNVRALRQRAPEHPALRRYREIARWLTGDGEATVDDGLKSLRRLVEDLGVPGLSGYGSIEAELEMVIDKARAASSMKGNPIELTEAELRDAVVLAL